MDTFRRDTILAVVVILVGFFIMISLQGRQPAPVIPAAADTQAVEPEKIVEETRPPQADNQQSYDAINGMFDAAVESGLLQKWVPESHEAFVDPGVWATLNVDIKTTILKTFSLKANAAKAGPMTIYDYMTGKKLAEIDLLGNPKIRG